MIKDKVFQFKGKDYFRLPDFNQPKALFLFGLMVFLSLVAVLTSAKLYQTRNKMISSSFYSSAAPGDNCRLEFDISPASTPTQSQCPASTAILNPSFETNDHKQPSKANWAFFSKSNQIFFTVESITPKNYHGNYGAKINIDVPPADNLQLYQKNFRLDPNTRYRLSFAAYSSTGHDLKVMIHSHTSPFTNLGLLKTFNLGTSWQFFNADFISTNTVVTCDTRLRFWFLPFAWEDDDYFIDQVSLEKLP